MFKVLQRSNLLYRDERVFRLLLFTVTTLFSGLSHPSFAGEQTCDLDIRKKLEGSSEVYNNKSLDFCSMRYTEEESEKDSRYVLSLAADINLATQLGNDEKALQLACLVFDYFREHDILNHIKYGGIDSEDNIIYERMFPTSFPTKIRRNNRGEIVDYTVDLESMKKSFSNSGACEYLVIFSPWTNSPLFKIKISKELLIYWTNE